MNYQKLGKNLKKRNRTPAQIMAFGFLAIILTGALLLMLPAASKEHIVTPFPDTLFTAVSATCVTGLVVVDTGVHWSLFGQIVILVMIQIGGLGFMSFALLLTGVFSKNVSPRVRNLAAQSFGMDSARGIKPLVRRIFVGTACIEGCGALLLMIRTIPLLGIGRGIFAGIFLSVSAFCNAGFDPLGGVYGEFSSLLGFGSDPLILLTLAAVIILGAAGFLVWSDLWDYFRTRKRISMYSRFVLIITGCLLGIGFLLIAILEWNNPATLGDMSVPEKLLQAFFQSVTPRTAGFDAIGQTEMTECAKAVSMMLMLIGGASGSTAGGIKVVTFGVLMAAVRSTLRGEKEIHVLKRRIDREAVTRAMAIMFFVLFAVFACAIFIAAFDGVALEAALYECFSAFCTVGLSLSLTPTLGYVSRAVLICAMFTGRVGILTLSVVLVPKESASADISYPEAKLLIG